jgi:hypothetical protein
MEPRDARVSNKRSSAMASVAVAATGEDLMDEITTPEISAAEAAREEFEKSELRRLLTPSMVCIDDVHRCRDLYSHPIGGAVTSSRPDARYQREEQD